LQRVAARCTRESEPLLEIENAISLHILSLKLKKRDAEKERDTHAHTRTRMQQKNQNDYKNTNCTGDVLGSEYVEVQNTVVFRIINGSRHAMRSEMTFPIRSSLLTHDMPKDAYFDITLYCSMTIAICVHNSVSLKLTEMQI